MQEAIATTVQTQTADYERETESSGDVTQTTDNEKEIESSGDGQHSTDVSLQVSITSHTHDLGTVPLSLTISFLFCSTELWQHIKV